MKHYKFKENEVVHCKTQEEADRIAELCNVQEGINFKPKHFEVYQKDTWKRLKMFFCRHDFWTNISANSAQNTCSKCGKSIPITLPKELKR